MVHLLALLATNGGASDLSIPRFVSLEEAPRSIYVPVTTNLHLNFDTERLRTHLIWSGAGLQLNGTPHTGSKTPFLSRPLGQVLARALLAGWWTGDEMPVADTGLGAAGKFIAWQHAGSRVSFTYQVGAGADAVEINESPFELPGFERGLGRRFRVGPARSSLWLAPLSEFTTAVNVRQIDRSTFALQDGDGWLVCAVNSVTAGPVVRFVVSPEELTFQFEHESKDESQATLSKPGGRLARLLISLPPHNEARVLDVFVARMSELPSDPTSLLPRMAAAFEASLARPVEATPARTISSRDLPVAPPRGDVHYRIEELPLPSGVALQVTGIDWLADGLLAVSTWQGDVWLVGGSDAAPGQARFRRFAAGLNEPLGVMVVDGELVVAQKPELTRIRDMDHDGVGDRYETLSAAWPFTGNYHAFTFGPALDGDGSFLVAFSGQRARWDVTYAGWLTRISADGAKLDPIAGGLRAPNGIGIYGPAHDLFVTDNQGNWIGACKLNHIRAGRTYGFPVAQPGTRDQWDHPSADFDPPAIWFPRKLAPSAAGLATIPDRGFGPFGGQLVVADFQNATVLRVALEKVNGRWQGAVFPFLTGFGSGANRLLFDPQGRLFVGGVKNKAWPSAGPREQSLDRVTFAGKAPFEIQTVHALVNGFELKFTEPVNRAQAGDPENYYVSQFTYRHHAEYGSAEFDHEGRAASATTIKVTGAVVDADGLRVRLKLAGWKSGYVTRVVSSGLENFTGTTLRSDEFYYTLNEIPVDAGIVP